MFLNSFRLWLMGTAKKYSVALMKNGDGGRGGAAGLSY